MGETTNHFSLCGSDSVATALAKGRMKA